MGIGDWVMATADARAFHAKTGLRCVFGLPDPARPGTNHGKHWWSDVFEHNPKITRPSRLAPGEQFVWVGNYPSSRPYVTRIEFAHSGAPARMHYNRAFRVSPGEIFLTDEEKEIGEMTKGCVIIEPNVKTKYAGPYQVDIGRNKAWPWERWEEVVKMPLPWIQLGPEDTREIGVRRVKTRSFREALAVLSGASLLVTTDGALQHAAAALGIPAVALFGGFATPEMMGYSAHRNIWNGADPCGTVTGLCPHCKEAMASITVEQVQKAIEEELSSG